MKYEVFFDSPDPYFYIKSLIHFVFVNMSFLFCFKIIEFTFYTCLYGIKVIYYVTLNVTSLDNNCIA